MFSQNILYKNVSRNKEFFVEKVLWILQGRKILKILKQKFNEHQKERIKKKLNDFA